MRSFFKSKKGSETLSPELIEEKEAGLASEIKTNMGWGDILSNLQRLNNSTAIEDNVEKLRKEWLPLIKDLKKISAQIKTKQAELMMPGEPNQADLQDPTKRFLALTEEMVAKVTALTESVQYDFYFVPQGEVAAQAIQANNAVILYKSDDDSYRARVIAKKSSKIKKDVDTIIEIPQALQASLPQFESFPRDPKNKVVLKEVNLEFTEPANYDLYFVPEGEEAAKEIKADNAVIIYKKADDSYGTRVIAKISPPLSHEVDVILTEIPKELKPSLAQLELTQRDAENKVIFIEANFELRDKVIKDNLWLADRAMEVRRETNLGLVDAAIKDLTQAAKIPQSKTSVKKILPVAISLADDLPLFLDAFAKLQIVPKVRERLQPFQTGTGYLNVSKMLKAVLPIERYALLRKKALDALESEKFAVLSREEQAAALGLMESYNAAIKAAVLAIDKIEIHNSLNVGALSTTVKIIDNKSIKELCEEFDKMYKEAMKVAGFPIQAELYPYDFSILEQRKAMLAALLVKKQENNSKLAKRIQACIDMQGEVQAFPNRTDPEDFYKFMQKILRENHRKLAKLKRQLAPGLEEKKDENSFDMTKEAKSMILKTEEKLKEILDERIFQTYFINETEADIKSPWIQQMANAFHNVKKIIAEVELLQQQHSDLLESNTPLNYLEHRVSEVNRLAAAGMELLTALNQIRGNVYFKNLISQKKHEGMALAKDWKQQAVIAASDVEAMLNEVKQSHAPLAVVMKKIQVIISEKAVIVDGELRKEAIPALTLATQLVEKLEIFHGRIDKDGEEKPNLLAFAVEHFGQIITIMHSLPSILSVLNKLSKKDAMFMMEEVNSTFEQMVLLADKLEIQFCLKEGYLTNKLQPMMMSYYAGINQLGYDFIADKRYPFPAAIAAQRNQLFKDENSPAFQKSIIHARIRATPTLEEKEQHRIKWQGKERLQEKKQEQIKEVIINAISEHIEKIKSGLEQHKKDSNAVTEVYHKIQLLTSFQEIAQQQKSVDVENILQNVRKLYPQNIHLLYEGNSGKMLEELEYKNVSPADISKALEVELAILRKQRGSTHYVYSIHKTKILEHRINACEKLQDFFKNHNLSDALGMLDSKEIELLQKYDHMLLNKLERIEKSTSVKHRAKTILGTMAAKNDPAQEVAAPVKLSAEHARALALIESRLNKLESASIISKSRGKDIKIELLKELKKNLLSEGTLQAAIHKVKTGEKAQYAYLMFEGRTGKAIKAAQNITMTKDELLYRLEADINSLKSQRYVHLHVFAQYRKAKVDDHIEGLRLLKKTIINSRPDQTLSEIINSLPSKERNVLQRYEADLLKDLVVKEAAPQQLRLRT